MISSNNDKSAEWTQQRSLRRFPENNVTTNSNNNNAKKSEIQQHHSWTSREPEHGDRKIQSLLSASLMNSSNIHSSDPESATNFSLPKRLCSTSPTNTQSSDGSSGNQLKNYMSTQTKSSSRISDTTITKETSDVSSTLIIKRTVTTETAQNRNEFVNTVLQNGDYLLKHNSWHEFRGAEEIKKCSRKVIERNENIWELVSKEYSHLKLLVNIRDVYCKSYPYLEMGSNPTSVDRSSSGTRSESLESEKSRRISDHKPRSNNFFESIETILPGMDPLIECHAKITNCLISNHVIRPDRVITEIGRVLHESIPDDFIPILAELYGRINYTKQYINQKLSQFKKYNDFLSYISKCERDPKCEKKTLADILLHISTHWSRKVTTLSSIILNTINDSQDLNNLMKFKEKIDRIVNEASSVMDEQMNSKLLESLIDNYEPSPDIEESERVYKSMTSENAKLIYNGKVHFELKKSSNGKLLSREVHGVALEDCIFFLQTSNEPGKTSPKYQLFSERDSAFPAILEWGKLYGYFRETDSKNSDAFSFYVIIEKPGPSIKRFFVGTPQDRNNWKKCMMQGFSRWQNETSDIKEADNQLNEEMKKIEKKWANTQFGIELIKNLDDSLRVQLEYRTVGFRCILEEELKRLTAGNGLIKRNSSNSVTTVTEGDQKKDDQDSGAACIETFLPDLSTREGIHDWLEVFMEWVNRLKFSLCSSGANITRSASEIEARKRPSIPTVKKCDTFSSRDSPTFDKRQTDVTFLNPPITKQKKDQRRISVTGFTNLFRINSKSVKHDDTDRGGDAPGAADHNIDGDKDPMAMSNLEMISEADCFLSGLSKDTVAAFNEINIAAKNITNELIDLRTQNLILESKVKKIQEENQSFREFVRKYQKSSSDNQSSPVIGNNGSLKSDTTVNPAGSASIGSLGSTELSAEGLESLSESSAGLTHTNQKMAECRQQTENLRQMYERFAMEKKKWEKEYESQRRKIANDQESFFQKNRELQKEKETLAEREKKYKDNCVKLQKKIDMYFETYGINLDDENPLHSNAKFQQILQMQPHFRSNSDDISHKHTSRHSTMSQGPLSPPLASTEATSYNSEQLAHGVNDQTNIPDQLKGSLINQRMFGHGSSGDLNFKERQSLKTNSSDNILETRGKVAAGSSAPKPKMTPSIDRKEIYSSSNMCFEVGDQEDACSDVEDVSPVAMRTSTHELVHTRRSVVTTVTRGGPPPPSVATGGGGAPQASTTVPAGLGIPLSLASKSKVKKDKSRKFRII